jgi:hypothetical protein
MLETKKKVCLYLYLKLNDPNTKKKKKKNFIIIISKTRLNFNIKQFSLMDIYVCNNNNDTMMKTYIDIYGVAIVISHFQLNSTQFIHSFTF